VHLPGETSEVFNRLRADVVKVDNVTNGMDHREEQSGACNDFMELDVRVQWNVLLDGELLEFGQQVPRHGQQKQ